MPSRKEFTFLCNQIIQNIWQENLLILFFIILLHKVPRKVLKERFESTPETDEPLRTDLEDHDDDNLYEDDQFYKESEAIPPAPKQQRPSEIPFPPATPSIGPPLPARDDTTLDGKWSTFRLIETLTILIKTVISTKFKVISQNFTTRSELKSFANN